MHELRFEHALTTLCRVLRVNRSSYYKHFYYSNSPKKEEVVKLKQLILNIYFEHKQAIGYFKLHKILTNEYCYKISAGRVNRLMDSMHLPKMSTSKPYKYHKNTPDNDEPCENLLNQQFNVDSPNTVWCGDFSYIKIGYKKHVYLCVIIDLFSRKIVGWRVSAKHDANMVIDTFNRAFLARNKPQNLMFHSDQGSEYTSKAFRKLLDNLRVAQSFSKKGYPYDNAVVECFFKYAKKENYNRYSYSSLAEVELASMEYIEGQYNSKRPHSHNNYLSPNKKEQDYFLSLNML